MPEESPADAPAGSTIPAPDYRTPQPSPANGSVVDYVGIIGAAGGLITAITGFFQVGSFASSFAFLFLSFLLFWIMFKSNTLNRLYMLSASLFLVAAMVCIYFVSFKSVRVVLRRTDPLLPSISYRVYINPGNSLLEYSKDLALDVRNLETITVDLNKADFEILANATNIQNAAFEKGKLQASGDIAPAPDSPGSKKALEATTETAINAQAVHEDIAPAPVNSDSSEAPLPSAVKRIIMPLSRAVTKQIKNSNPASVLPAPSSFVSADVAESPISAGSTSHSAHAYDGSAAEIARQIKATLGQ